MWEALIFISVIGILYAALQNTYLWKVIRTVIAGIILFCGLLGFGWLAFKWGFIAILFVVHFIAKIFS